VPDVERVTTALSVAGPAIVGVLFLQADSAARKTARAGSRASRARWWVVYPVLALGAALPSLAANQDMAWQALAWTAWTAIGAAGVMAARRRTD
jgi:hypothetical protein